MGAHKLEKIGMIAGNGIYPATFARAARAAGVKTLVVSAFKGETEASLADEVEVMQWLRVGQLSKMIRFFQREEVTQAVMVGQIAPKNLFDLRPDLRTVKLLARLKKKNAESIFGGIADELAKEGIELLPATTFLDDLLPAAGPVCGPKLSENAQQDAEFGFFIAKEMSRLDIGQTVVVKNGTVLAVEAFEGTNEAIRRGGKMGKGKATMVKVSKPKQDLRFDVPVVGEITIETAVEAGITTVVVEAGRTLLLGKEELFVLCEKKGVSLVAVESMDEDDCII
ncbi:MAG: UDP-2,3-diacylglucosamine diphosphatase LpxI [Verrucomicrobiales bacterium]|nr:UDP-2,3-diacylglucosamine diphosphatase LpxI [Verrucomicrobiales bacterium]